jgi:hypothetical protein
VQIEAGLRDTGTGTQHPGIGCRRGKPQGFARAQERQHHQPLLCRRAWAVDRGGKQSIGNRLARPGADDLEKENGMIPRKSR